MVQVKRDRRYVVCMRLNLGIFLTNIHYECSFLLCKAIVLVLIEILFENIECKKNVS